MISKFFNCKLIKIDYSFPENERGLDNSKSLRQAAETLFINTKSSKEF
jgi:hypothetical protein